MNKQTKIIIIFSVIFWLLIAIGIIIMSFTFGQVPVGNYGLRIDYFSPAVDNQYYTNGVYNKGIGHYFVLYPRTKQYVMDQKITVINKDL